MSESKYEQNVLTYYIEDTEKWKNILEKKRKPNISHYPLLKSQ